MKEPMIDKENKLVENFKELELEIFKYVLSHEVTEGFKREIFTSCMNTVSRMSFCDVKIESKDEELEGEDC